MDQLQANKIIVEELSRYYDLSKYLPSPAIFEEFLNSLDPETAKKLKAQYNHETGYKNLWIYKHWYHQKYHYKEMDELMKLVLLPGVYSYYTKRFKPIIKDQL